MLITTGLRAIDHFGSWLAAIGLAHVATEIDADARLHWTHGGGYRAVITAAVSADELAAASLETVRGVLPRMAEIAASRPDRPSGALYHGLSDRHLRDALWFQAPPRAHRVRGATVVEPGEWHRSPLDHLRAGHTNIAATIRNLAVLTEHALDADDMADLILSGPRLSADRWPAKVRGGGRNYKSPMMTSLHWDATFQPAALRAIGSSPVPRPADPRLSALALIGLCYLPRGCSRMWRGYQWSQIVPISLGPVPLRFLARLLLARERPIPAIECLRYHTSTAVTGGRYVSYSAGQRASCPSRIARGDRIPVERSYDSRMIAVRARLATEHPQVADIRRRGNEVILHWTTGDEHRLPIDSPVIVHPTLPLDHLLAEVAGANTHGARC